MPTPNMPGRARRGRARWWLLAGYVSAYGGFIAVTVVSPGTLAVRAVAGLNLAVAWGLGLIALAFVIAVAAIRLPEDR
ncbi:MAG: DUF485 domain-containing protein [Phycisphaerales bacterium]